MAEDIPEKLISKLLDKVFPGAEFGAPVPLDGDASTREYFRIKASGQDPVIVMTAPNEKAVDTFCEMTSLMKELGADTPAIYGADGRAAAIEDLSDTLLQNIVAELNQADLIVEYEALLDDLIEFQRRALKRQDKSLPCFNLSFDQEKLTEEVEFTHRYFLDKFLGSAPGPAGLTAMRSEWEWIINKLADQAPVLTHRDLHSRNIMVKGERRVWIDYQDARMGRLQYDLASLLLDPYVNLPEEITKNLADYYYGKLPEIVDSPPGYDEFFDIYELSAAQRLFKAVGTFGYQACVKGVYTYVQYVPAAVSALRKLFNSHPDMKRLGELLEESLPPEV